MTTSSSADRFTICQIGAFHGAGGASPTSADTFLEQLRGIGIDSVWASKHTRTVRRVSDMFWTVVRHSRRYRVMVLYVYSGHAFGWAVATAVLARLLNKRLIMWMHGGNLPKYYQAHRRLVSFAFKQADYLLVPSLYLARTFDQDFDIHIMRAELPIALYPFQVRQQLKPRLFWLRAFNKDYNPMLAPRVVKLLAEDYPAVELLMCGSDKGDGSLQATQQLAQELGVADRIRFPGLISKEQIRQYGQEYDLFLNTTTIDNTPLSVIEAMAMGMCVVSTNVGGVPYLVTDEQDGLLVPSNDAQAMAQACRRLLTDPVLAQRVSRQGRATAEQFDWEAIKPQWEELLTRLHYQ